MDKYFDPNEKVDGFLSNMKAAVLLIIVGDFWTILKDLQKKLSEFEIRRRIVTIYIAALLKSVRIEEFWKHGEI